MGLTIRLYNEEGESLGELVTEAHDHPVVPRQGESVRITQGAAVGDYVVEFVRWRLPEADVQVLCRRAEDVDTWPDLDARLPEHRKLIGAAAPPEPPKRRSRR